MLELIHVTTVPDSLAFFSGHTRYLQSRGFRVRAVSSPGSLADRFRAVEGIPVYAVPMARSLSPVSDAVALWRLWRLFLVIKPDIVHSHTPKAGLLGTLAARLAGVRVVFLSVFGLPQMTRTGLTRHLLNVTTRVGCIAAHRVWCDSPSMRDCLRQAGLCQEDKIVVCGHGSVDGVDALLTFSPERWGSTSRGEIRARYGIPRTGIVIGYVGRIVRDKGIHEMVAAWQVLRERHEDLHLLMLGSFEADDRLSADDERTLRNDARVHLTGHRSDVAPHYAAMDIFLMPSHREGFGIANIEAAAMELPVVSTRIPGCVDSVQDGVTGTLVPPREADALRSAVEMYLRSPGLRRQHGWAGRMRVLRDFRPDEIRESLRQEYLRLLARK
jgi:glycosyltransferase involved in cell wall biosynthesis